MKLSKIKKISLREVWKHEALDFTNWLAEEENLNLLSDEVGIDIKLIRTEASVGSFNVDILAEEENTGNKIIIENQLEVTNHDHLGKILTYSSGYDANYMIWIVKDVRDEHKQAIDWLNEHTDEDINFFIIRMEIWQIDESPYAPKFYVVSKPNNWQKTIKENISKNGLTDTKLKQLKFWESFREYSGNRESILRLRKPRAQHWYDISAGSSDWHISLTINSQSKTFGCEVYIPDNKEIFYMFNANKEKIESDLGLDLEWMDLENKKASRIKAVYKADFENEDDWEKYFDWLFETAVKFYATFRKYSVQ